MRLFLIILAIFSLAGYTAWARVGDRLPDNGVREIYLAKDDGTGKAGEAATDFVTTDVPIYCVVMLESTESAEVKMSLVAVDVQGTKPETTVVSSVYTTSSGEDRVNFSGRPFGKWIAGKYRADIYLQGKLAVHLDFDIEKSRVTKNSAQAASIITTNNQ